MKKFFGYSIHEGICSGQVAVLKNDEYRLNFSSIEEEELKLENAISRLRTKLTSLLDSLRKKDLKNINILQF